MQAARCPPRSTRAPCAETGRTQERHAPGWKLGGVNCGGGAGGEGPRRTVARAPALVGRPWSRPTEHRPTRICCTCHVLIRARPSHGAARPCLLAAHQATAMHAPDLLQRVGRHARTSKGAGACSKARREGGQEGTASGEQAVQTEKLRGGGTTHAVVPGQSPVCTKLAQNTVLKLSGSMPSCTSRGTPAKVGSMAAKHARPRN